MLAHSIKKETRSRQIDDHYVILSLIFLWAFLGTIDGPAVNFGIAAGSIVCKTPEVLDSEHGVQPGPLWSGCFRKSPRRFMHLFCCSISNRTFVAGRMCRRYQPVAAFFSPRYKTPFSNSYNLNRSTAASVPLIVGTEPELGRATVMKSRHSASRFSNGVTLCDE